MPGTIHPTARAESAQSVQSPVFILTRDATTTVAYLDLRAWINQYVAVVFIGDQGWLACAPAASGSYAITASVTNVAANENGIAMFPVPDGVEKQFLVSEAYPFLAYKADAGTAVISVHRS